jgi:tagaturonate epimerase
MFVLVARGVGPVRLEHLVAPDSITVTSLGPDIVGASVVNAPNAQFALARGAGGLRLVILGSQDGDAFEAFEGDRSAHAGRFLLVGPLSSRNAAALRARLSWLRPSLVGLHTSGGFGDRLGRATPGHIRALRSAGGNIAPVFAQQSMREMARTGRTPAGVLDDATWGVFHEGWTGGFGTDADHLKTTDDVDVCLAAGFTGFTIDPGEHVWSGADQAPAADVQAAVGQLPWGALEDTEPSLVARYAGRRFDVGGATVAFEREDVLRAAAKYGKAVAHVVRMYRHLLGAAGEGRFEVEVSVDETDSPTSHAEHYYVASELRRLGVKWIGLAPRYVGRFEKGVDYIGDLGAFERDLEVHAHISRALGPYKLSLHSGSDKFAIYPMIAAHCRGFVHLKTAGTSYLEALRAVAQLDPEFFREIYAFCRGRYDTDKASYHVSARLEAAPAAEEVFAAALPSLLDQFDARQILHVTFGSVLTERGSDGRRRFYDRFMAVLDARPDVYSACLERHFGRHLAPFVAAGTSAARS